LKLIQRIGTILLPLVCLTGPAISQEIAKPLERLKQLHRQLMDPNEVFSIKATLAELNTLEKQITAQDEEARGELNFLRGFVLNKADRPKEALPPSLEALRIDDFLRFLPDGERTRLTYDVALRAEQIGDWTTAINFYSKAAPLFDASSEYSADQRLGLRERLAYCLHEAGRYAEALAMNKQVLAGGEKLFGNESVKLFTVLTNLAQNAHALGDPDMARSSLERMLALATKHNVPEQADTALFQLGVLSFEQGRHKEAETLMKRRLDLTEKSGDARRIADAKEDLEILYEKMPR
jgi:tetratricopeptide (TPR) repeat protein